MFFAFFQSGRPDAGTHDDDRVEVVLEAIIDTSHLLVGVNSAANFFLYCLLRKNFRIATWRILTCSKMRENSRYT